MKTAVRMIIHVIIYIGVVLLGVDETVRHGGDSVTVAEVEMTGRLKINFALPPLIRNFANQVAGYMVFPGGLFSE